jgi:serine/threonine protein kinase
MIISNKYKFINEIGNGRFSTIYKGFNIRTNNYVAIKVEPLNNETKMLKNETIIYQYLNGGKGIPSVLWFGNDSNNNYMVLNLLGHSLKNIIDNKVIISLRYIFNITIQMIERLKYIHNRGLIHRDIKPENFLFGLEENNDTLYLIDFGFCKKYINNGKHIELKNNNNITGTPNYMSINLHNGLEPSRRDDLESVFYISYYLLNGFLEWDNSRINNMREMKSQLSQDNNIPKQLKEYNNYCRELQFDEMPDYDYLISLFIEKII